MGLFMHGSNAVGRLHRTPRVVLLFSLLLPVPLLHVGHHGYHSRRHGRLTSVGLQRPPQKKLPPCCVSRRLSGHADRQLQDRERAETAT